MKHLLEKIRNIYNEYPRAFWTYNIIVFIDRFGGFMLYHFFALYMTQKFGIGMSTVGLVFMLFSVSGFVGSALGGAITKSYFLAKVALPGTAIRVTATRAMIASSADLMTRLRGGTTTPPLRSSTVG